MSDQRFSRAFSVSSGIEIASPPAAFDSSAALMSTISPVFCGINLVGVELLRLVQQRLALGRSESFEIVDETDQRGANQRSMPAPSTRVPFWAFPRDVPSATCPFLAPRGSPTLRTILPPRLTVPTAARRIMYVRNPAKELRGWTL